MTGTPGGCQEWGERGPKLVFVGGGKRKEASGNAVQVAHKRGWEVSAVGREI